MAFEIGNPTNYKIRAILLKEYGKAYKFNCEGNIVIVPKSQCFFEPILKILEIPEWLYKEKFPNG